jgi:hypothetical protein
VRLGAVCATLAVGVALAACQRAPLVPSPAPGAEPGHGLPAATAADSALSAGAIATSGAPRARGAVPPTAARSRTPARADRAGAEPLDAFDRVIRIALIVLLVGAIVFIAYQAIADGGSGY